MEFASLHPDNLAAALKRELARSGPERHEEIKAELARIEKLPRPEIHRPEEPALSVDPRHEYLRALEREIARSAPERHEEIRAELNRVKAELRSADVSTATDAPAGESTIARRRVRSGRPDDATEE